jgi:signal transduction histidine kinase
MDGTSRMTVEHNLFSRATSLAVHELRTPVTVVAGYLRMLLREQAGPLSDRQKKMLEEAERSCARLGAVVAEMSEVGKLESGELAVAQQDVDLAALLAELASGMQEGEDRGVTLEVRGIDRPLVVSGDRVRLSAALGALMRSVLRERGDPGVIVVDASIETGGAPASAVVAMGDVASLASLAEGRHGTPPPFREEWRGGLGMALPIARRVIERHGGALWSADGTQSRAACAIRLPLRT